MCRMTVDLAALTPDYVSFVIETLNRARFQAFIVGGCVRDVLSGQNPKDWDVATSATPEEVRTLFKRTADTGAAHGTITVIVGGQAVEVTTFRVDGAYSDGRRPDSVSFTDKLNEDLARRDFTMNAIAFHKDTGIVDPFGGAEDIAARVIRGVGDPASRFREDALRMLRAIRFSAQLGFDIEPATYAAIVENAHLVALETPAGRAVSIERVRDEFMKTLVSKRPERLRLLLDTGLMRHICGETEGYLLEHMERTLPVIMETGRNPVQRLALLFMHMPEGGCRNTLKFFRLDNNTVREASLLAKWLLVDVTDDFYAVRKAVSDIGRERLAVVLELQGLARAGNEQAIRGAAGKLADVTRAGDCCSLEGLALNGNDIKKLGVTVGARVGETLQYLLDAVLRRPELNNREALTRLAAEHLATSR